MDASIGITRIFIARFLLLRYNFVNTLMTTFLAKAQSFGEKIL